MAQKSVIIIGAGLAGLATGCYARMNGYKARIFEHGSKSGGVAAAWRRKDYIIDGGIHFLMGHRPGQKTYDLYHELGVFESNRVLDMETYMEYVDQAGNRSLNVGSDLERLAGDMKAISPADSRAIDEFISAARAFRGSDVSGGMDTAQELMGFGGTIRQMWGMRRIFKYMIGKFGRSVDEYSRGFRDPWLREVINYLFLPEVPVWFVLMLLALLADRQLGLVEGGSLDFVQAIEKRYRDLGGELTFRATVEKILTDDDQAVGIRLADGVEHPADVIVSAADGYSTIYDMLEGRYTNGKIDERYKNWKLFRPLLIISYGVAREFPGEAPIGLIKPARPMEIGGERVERISYRIFNYSRKFAPPRKTVCQVLIETSWDYWNDLQAKDRPGYDAAKERVAAETLARLEERWPGITSQVEMTDVATPYTMWRHTRNRRGAFEGFQITPKAVMTRIPKTLPGLRDFYMAGQWVMPGGGVPPCLYSGKHVVQLMCKKDGKEFVGKG